MLTPFFLLDTFAKFFIMIDSIGIIETLTSWKSVDEFNQRLCIFVISVMNKNNKNTIELEIISRKADYFVL